MAQVSKLYKEYFLQYSSYVIRDRAIPSLVDGLKPVQRRILHSLFTMDDGKFHKVANVVGETMKYHPHGDSSIYGALVNLANHDMFIEKQGNFGNILTGENAAAGRYIECRLLPLAKEVLYNPELTEYIDSYDGRAKEPVIFPAKIPVVLIQGTEGIAVGMRTQILPHNPIEVLDCMKSAINGRSFSLYPDLPTGGTMDVAEYEDGLGKVLLRAKIRIRDSKRVVIEELPYGVTSEAMIDSITRAVKSGKIKVSQITDYTTDKVSIEIEMPRGVSADEEFVKALYAFTSCENRISVNSLVIRDEMPVQMGVSEIVKFHAFHLMDVLEAEEKLKKAHLEDELYARTLDRIFIEQRIYKKIENKDTAEKVENAIIRGFKPFESELSRAVETGDVQRLLKIPIRRISLFDINKNREQIEQINQKIEQCDYRLSHLKKYTLGYIDTLQEMIKESRKINGEPWKRMTRIDSFETIDVKDAAQRNLSLNYDASNGYLGYEVSTGKTLFKVNEFDRILIIRKDGTYMVIDVPGKEFVGKGMRYCSFSDKEVLKDVVFTVIYQEKKYKYLFIKRCQILSFQLKKLYNLLPKGNFKMVNLSTYPNAELMVDYVKKPGMRVLSESFFFSDEEVRGKNTKGRRLTVKEIKKLKIREVKEVKEEQKELFDE